MSTTQRAALGRVAKIGSLYDVRTESFTGDTLFTFKLDDDTIDTTDLGSTSIELVMSDNMKEKYKILDVEAELQVSLLSGLVKLSGSGGFLSEEKMSARAQSMSLVYKLRTANEEVMISQHKDKINTDIFTNHEAMDATHVVYAIDWGAACTIACEYENTENEDGKVVKDALSAELRKLKGLIDAKGSIKFPYEDQSSDSHKKFKFSCKADVSAPGTDLPVTFKGAVNFARSLPNLVKNTNKGKGVPLTFMLMPLERAVKMCKLQIQLQNQYKSIGDDIITQCGQVVEEITKTRQTLYDIQYDLSVSADYVPEESLVRIDDILKNFALKESGFRGRLQDMVKNVRSGNKDIASLVKLVGEGMSDTLSFLQCNAYVREFQKDFNKLKSVKSLQSKGIVYIGRKDEVILDDKKYVYVFYKTSNEDDTDSLDINKRFFLSLHKTHAQDGEDYKFVVVDQELRKDLWPAGQKTAVVYKFVNGTLSSKDSYSREGLDPDLCLIKNDAAVYTQIRPSNRANVKIQCPNALSGNGECSGNPVNWMCSKCKQIVEYGIETKLLYCKCGKSDPRKALFRCNETDHSIDFVKYPDDILTIELSRLRAVEEKNILILGETGVGKSTWINSFTNYLTYPDMKEAINANECQVLIPSSFTFSQQGKVTEILIGEPDSNENMDVGHSATKDPRSYVFFVDQQKICLIDTPGIGDSEGIDQDRKNFDNILYHLSNYDEIHAVCILLKPNNSRLTVMFRFCIQELLANLHTSVKDNIVFCFTNCRQTFYQPGDTLGPLNRELVNRNVGFQATPHNYFCFDNEAFRFLACIQNGVEFSKEHIDTYAESWDKSVQETNRLFEHIKTLPPHKVRNTVNMNEARRIIVAMSKPLAQVATIIEQNIQQGNDHKTKIDKDNRKLNDLQKTLKFSGFNVGLVQLGYPRTVCADSKCVEYVQVGKEKVQNKVYNQICHPHCKLRGVPTETTNDPRLKECWCINQTDSTCHQCGHDFKVHMHITYETKIVETQFLSDDVQAEINQNKSRKEGEESAKRAIEIKIKELILEKEIIMKTCAKYGSFLKVNAIIPYNDAVGDYLDMCIDQERTKDKTNRNKTLLTTLENMKKQYKREREILDDAIGTDSGKNINTPEEVMELQKTLFGLKHMGKNLEGLFKGISIANSANNFAFKEKFAPIHQNSKTTRTWRESFSQSARSVLKGVSGMMYYFSSSKSEK